MRKTLHPAIPKHYNIQLSECESECAVTEIANNNTLYFFKKNDLFFAYIQDFVYSLSSFTLYRLFPNHWFSKKLKYC